MLHMVVTSKIKKGLNLALNAKAYTKNSAVHLAGESSPIITIQSILENVKDIPEFTKRIPVDRIYDSGKEFDDPNG